MRLGENVKKSKILPVLWRQVDRPTPERNSERFALNLKGIPEGKTQREIALRFLPRFVMLIPTDKARFFVTFMNHWHSSALKKERKPK